MKKLVCAIIGGLVLVGGSMAAQTVTVTGVLLSAAGNEPIAGASVALLRRTDSSTVTGAYTQKNGRFVLQSSVELPALLRCSFVGYEPRLVTVARQGDAKRTDTLDLGVLELTPKSNAEVVVSADKPIIEYHDGKKVFNVSEAIAAAGGNALDVLKQVPTVNVDLEGNVTVSGLPGVNIMIDNKPISAYGNPAQILKTLPAGALDKVEVIANPGAAYDAQGQVGILNLVIKRQTASGLNGIVDLNAGLYDNYSGAATINNRSSKLNLNVGSDFYSLWQRRYRSVETIFSSTDQLDRTGTSINKNHSYAFRLGGEYVIDTSNTVSVSSEVRYNNGRNADPWNNTSTSSGVSSYQYMDQSSGGPTTSLGFTGTHTLNLGSKDHQLITNLYYFPDWFDVTNTILTTPTDQNGAAIGASTGRLSQTVGNGTYAEALSDYKLALGEHRRIEAGVDFTLQIINSAFNFSDYNAQNSEWVSNASLSNGAWHRDEIIAGYMNLADQFGGLSVSGGLRYEYTSNAYRNRDDATLDFSRAFSNLFPSVSLSYALTDEQSVQLSYSRRINRPTGPQLNPYIDKTDSLYWRSGNPALLPEYTNSYRLGVLQYFDNNVANLEVFYRETSNAIQQRYRTEVEPGVLLEKPYNFGKGLSYGLTGTANLTLAPWLTANGELSYYYQYSGGEFNGEIVETSGSGWNARVILGAQLPFDIRSQVFCDYTAPQVIPQGVRREFAVFTVAMNREFREQHLTVGFNWSDIFNTGQFGGSVQGDGFSSTILNRRDYPLFTVNVSYRINDYRGPKPTGVPGGAGGGAGTI